MAIIEVADCHRLGNSGFPAGSARLGKMLKLTKRADYGLIAMRHLAEHPVSCSAKDIAESHGIPPELLGHIFDPWVTTKAHGKGSGLGLSIARQVILSHGGTIRVRNRPSHGAVFTIDLPAAPGSHPHAHIAHAENSRR